MSYREMRSFTEMMRSLGYQRVISMENFRTSNFVLVAEILRWLVLRYDSQTILPQSLESEQDRILFIKIVLHCFLSKACIKLSGKRIYQADGFAVKELIKITKTLYSARKACCIEASEEENYLNVTEIFDINKVKEIHEGRNLSTLLSSSGASLHSLLTRELKHRESRDSAIRRQVDSEWIEKSVIAAINSQQSRIEKTQASLVNIAADEASLDGKIEKKLTELERNRKRLATLHSVRPAYMDEYKQLEDELSYIYSLYLTKFRNLTFLENQYDELLRNKTSLRENGEITLKHMAEQMNFNKLKDSLSEQALENSTGVQNLTVDYFNNDEDDDDEIKDHDDEDDDIDDDDGDDDDDNDNDLKLEHNLDENNFEEKHCNIERNQLSYGWSPSRQRISGASHHGRTHNIYNSEQIQNVGFEPEENVGLTNLKTKNKLGKKYSKKNSNLLSSDLFSGELIDTSENTGRQECLALSGTTTYDLEPNCTYDNGGICKKKQFTNKTNTMHAIDENDDDDDF